MGLLRIKLGLLSSVSPLFNLYSTKAEYRTVNAGASEALSDAQATANTAYEPTSAITVYTNPARK